MAAEVRGSSVEEHPAVLLGLARCKLRVLSANVTLLTKARLQTVLAEAADSECSIVCLQETRHLQGGFPWATRLARRAGWCMQWSPESGLDAGGRRRPGGTALLWRPALGRGTPVQHTSHRHCGRQWKDLVVFSMYGDAQRADLRWLLGVLTEVEMTGVGHALCVGDFNWRRAYEAALVGPWTAAPAIPTVVGSPAAPTRCMMFRTTATEAVAKPLLGVPHHCGVMYTFEEMVPEPAPAQRLTWCASFQWHEGQHRAEAVLRAAADAAGPELRQQPGRDLLQSWRTWHARAEAVCNAAVGMGIATLERKPERAKGSWPTSRPTARGGAHRPPEGIAVRRLRRLHRAAAEQLKRAGPDSPLTDAQVRHWGAAVRDAVEEGLTEVPHTQEEAVAAASKAAALVMQRERQAAVVEWRKRFARWSREALAAAKHVLRPNQPPANFTAADMRADWAKWWAPEPAPQEDEAEDACSCAPDRAEVWRCYADEAQMPRVPQAEWDPPCFEDFTQALRDTSGAAGFDGWERRELVALAEHAPWVVRELHALLVLTTLSAEAGLPGEVVSSLYAWRVVGIPKRGTDEARPIAVGSCIIRAWHRALLPQLPGPPPGQWCGRKGESVVTAVADWLHAPGAEGAELDLEKAFDAVDQRVAAAALEHAGTPVEVIALLRTAWAAPRVCHVHGELSAPIHPTRGIPPGAPDSPCTLGAVLAPWPGVVAKCAPEVAAWAFMDDRSLKGLARHGARQLPAALAATAGFDAAIGLRENTKKRQVWSGDEAVEHLGLRVQGNPQADALKLPAPRDGWGPTMDLVRRLASIPGSAAVRERLAAVFIGPRMHWAAPLIEPPPPEMEKELRRAVLATACTWWCRGRWWCDRVELHPVLGTALRALKRARGVAGKPSAMVREALRAHTKGLGLQVAHFDERFGLWVRPARGADPRTCAAARAARAAASELACPVRWGDAFSADHPAGAHAARIAGRVKALSVVRNTRYDAEGIRDVDLEAQSQPVWTRWARTLPDDGRRDLRIWRGGAVWTPTRRWSFRGQEEDERIRCCYCGFDRASARHFWTECPRFDAQRSGLEREFNIHPSWWSRQPRCTAKTGWITAAAGPTVQRRAELQVAACRLGLHVMAALRLVKGAVEDP